MRSSRVTQQWISTLASVMDMIRDAAMNTLAPLQWSPFSPSWMNRELGAKLRLSEHCTERGPKTVPTCGQTFKPLEKRNQTS
jgi:hypothetical protein